MYKFILLTLLTIVNPEETIEWYKGSWIPVVEYPPSVLFPICDKQKIFIQARADVKCICDDKEVAAVNLTIYDESRTELMPVTIVHSAADVADALSMKCKCLDQQKLSVVYRKINENYFVLYDKSYGHFTDTEPNKALLFLRKIPKLSELRKVMASIDDLSQRKAGYLCEPNYFVNEFEDLD